MGDKRKFIRIRVSLPVEIYDELNDNRLSGKIIDLSAGGAILLTGEELPVDTPVSLDFEFDNIRYKHLAADVTRSRKKENETRLGVVFFKPDERLSLIHI